MNITPSATEQLERVLGPGEALEIGLRTGGCSGATITMDRVELTNTSESNTKRTGSDCIVFADPQSQTYLGDGEIDYVSDGLMASFVVKPPAGIQSCGCGSSIVIA